MLIQKELLEIFGSKQQDYASFIPVIDNAFYG
jgi:hypothetical protein